MRDFPTMSEWRRAPLFSPSPAYARQAAIPVRRVYFSERGGAAFLFSVRQICPGVPSFFSFIIISLSLFPVVSRRPL